MSMATFGVTSVVSGRESIPKWLVFLFATTCGLSAANIYYAQPIINVIATSLIEDVTTASFVITLAQLGYCAGLIFLVPLGDLFENRRLIVTTLAVLTLALVAAAIAPTSELFYVSMLVLGTTSVTAQMIVPVAARMASEQARGQVVGMVMSGLFLGVLLSRPVSILITDAFGWRAVFAISAALMTVLAVLLRKFLPVRKPVADHSYVELIASLWGLWRDTPALRTRAWYQASLFASFTLFWTVVPLHLAGDDIGLKQSGIALFSLVGTFGVLVSPVAGRLADRGKSHAATGLSLFMVIISFVMAFVWTDSLLILVVASILLDVGVQANLVVGQRTIYSLNAEQHSRLNGLYIALFFVGGAAGSALSSPLYEYAGWALICFTGSIFPVLGLVLYVNESKARS
jgi:predicted MFS family arabinose efflux permease